MYTPKRPLLIHQEECLEYQYPGFPKAKDMTEFAFLVDMGGGKTKITIDNAAYLYQEDKISRWLCIAPNGVYKNWLREFAKDMPDNIPWVMQVWKEKNTRESQLHSDTPLYILLMNIEALSKKKGLAYAKKFVNSRTLVSIDESTTIKGHTSIRSKSAIELGRAAGYRRILSGYPTPQNQLDMYMQFNFLNPDIFGCKSYYAFRNEYAVVREVSLGPGRPRFPQIVGPKNMEQLKEKIAPYSYRIRKDECLDLPPKVYQIRETEMTGEQAAVYEEMRKHAIAELSTGELVSADLVLTQLIRLHQISCGFSVTQEKEIKRFKTNSKIEALKDILDQTSDKVIVWATYVDNIQEIQDDLSRTYSSEEIVTYYGGTSEKDREQAITAFERGGRARVFIGNPSTGGYGLSLVSSPLVVYFSNSYNLEHRLQSEDRAHRIGQERSVTYIDLVNAGTVDEKILKALMNKQTIGADILGDPIRWKDLFNI